ncbi:MAG: DUF2062 domain-containing protein [Phormidesmis sp. RL_2_1]|nr:DUF2062 domain-containing protein [Phormidesmis sp. RL_2_1]
MVGGNKITAVASTWISNPLTYVPLFALNFHLGSWLLRLPAMSLPTSLPTSSDYLKEWMAMGMDVVSALMLGSFIVGIMVSILGYYSALNIAHRLQKARARKAKERM